MESVGAFASSFIEAVPATLTHFDWAKEDSSSKELSRKNPARDV
jgi:hypothetical protein